MPHSVDVFWLQTLCLQSVTRWSARSSVAESSAEARKARLCCLTNTLTTTSPQYVHFHLLREFFYISKNYARQRHAYCILCIGNDIAFAICSDLYDIQGHLTGSKHVKLQFLVPLFIG